MVFFKGGCRSSRGSVDWVARGCGFGSACGNYVAAISPDFGKLGKGLGTKMRAISLVTQTIVWGRMSARGLVFLLGGAGRLEDGSIGLLGVAALGWARGKHMVETLTDFGHGARVWGQKG